MTGRRILIDTGAIYAFVTQNDAHHQAAKSFVRNWLDQGGVFVLADIVFAETMTLLKSRLGSAIAIQVGKKLRNHPAYAWREMDTESERQSWAIFRRNSDKDWSYTDSAILALSLRERIGGVFAFDHHFRQMPQIEVLPANETNEPNS